MPQRSRLLIVILGFLVVGFYEVYAMWRKSAEASGARPATAHHIPQFLTVFVIVLCFGTAAWLWQRRSKL